MLDFPRDWWPEGKKQTEQKETLPQPKKQQSVANVNKKCLKSSTHWGFGIGASHLQWLHQWSPLSSISLSRRCRDSSSWLLRVSASFGWKGSLEIIENLDVVRVWNDQWIGLRENFNRKTPYLMGKSMVSCEFSRENQSIEKDYFFHPQLFGFAARVAHVGANVTCERHWLGTAILGGRGKYQLTFHVSKP